MAACIITGVVCLFVGAFVGIGVVALMVAADDRAEHECDPLPDDKEGSDNGRC